MTREEAKEFIAQSVKSDVDMAKVADAIKALEQKDITWIVGNDNVQIAVRNMPVDMMQKINAIIGNKQEPTTKNCRTCRNQGSHNGVCDICKKYSCWTEIEPTNKNDSCGEQMDFPDTFDEFAKDYGFRDKKEIYTNGSELIPVFRVKQWLEHISTTKNDLGLDAISRDEVCRYVAEFVNHEFSTREEEELIDNIITGIEHMPSVIPQEPKCKDCKWWKDSDGKFRRGCGAESICRINTDKVYQGEGYCYLFEPQESEDT